jgi:hypothetical protein
MSTFIDFDCSKKLLILYTHVIYFQSQSTIYSNLCLLPVNLKLGIINIKKSCYVLLCDKEEEICFLFDG